MDINSKDGIISARKVFLTGTPSRNGENRYILTPRDKVVFETAEATPKNDEVLHEDSVKLMSPMQMVLRRFFRSKLSIIGLVMIVALFVFCWLGPVIYTKWDSTVVDNTGKVEYTYAPVKDENGNILFYQVVETGKVTNFFAEPSASHPMGTDKNGRDVLARLMVGGRISLVISFLSVFIITLFGVIFGGIAG